MGVEREGLGLRQETAQGLGLGMRRRYLHQESLGEDGCLGGDGCGDGGGGFS